MAKVFIADVDNSLSSGYYIMKFADNLYKLDLFPKRELTNINDAAMAYKEGDGSYDQHTSEIMEFFGKGLKGIEESHIRWLGQKYIQSNPDEVYSFVPELIEVVKERGYRPVLLSGSPEEIITPFAMSIDVGERFTTRYVVDGNGRYTGEIWADCATEKGKKDVFNRFIAENGFNLQESAGLGDSDADMSYLGQLGHPMVINPSSNLKRTAMEKGWLICDNHAFFVDDVKTYLPQ